MLRRLPLLLALITSIHLHANTPTAIPLWPEGAPGSETRRLEPEKKQGNNISNVHNPSLTPYFPKTDNNTGLAVIIAPGGGHSKLCVGHEGHALAEWFRDHGIAAFVFKYRLARDPDSNGTYTIQDHAMVDTRRAIRFVRHHAKDWHIQPNRIGILGFSAGGELAAFSAMKNDPGNPQATDTIEHASSRPDFQALIYPGTSRLFTVEKGMPPLFIACGYNDRPDIAKGMAELYLKYKQANVKAELHIYSNAGHGFGYKHGTSTAAGAWPFRLREWLVDSGFIAKK